MDNTTDTDFQVDVFHTDRTRTDLGDYTQFRARLTVQADTPLQALLDAMQMVAATRPDGMVLGAQIVL